MTVGTVQILARILFAKRCIPVLLVQTGTVQILAIILFVNTSNIHVHTCFIGTNINHHLH